RTLRFSSNWELSKARAESVARLLAVRVDPGRLAIDGLGDTQPIAPNDTPKGQARNRRAEIVLHVPAEGAPETTVTTTDRKPLSYALGLFSIDGCSVSSRSWPSP